MNDTYAALMAQTPYSWHEGGLLMGMHWAWWIFVVGTTSVSATILTLLVVPACYSLLKEWSLKREEAQVVAELNVLEPEPTGAD